jgi:hypothetical protein
MDELALLRREAPPTSPPSAIAVAAVHAAVNDSIEPDRTWWMGRWRRLLKARTLLPAMAVALTLALVLVALDVGSTGGVSQAARLLKGAAAAIGQQRLRPGQFYYQRFRSETTMIDLPVPGSTAVYSASVVSEGSSWIDARGSGRLSSTRRLAFPRPGDRALWRQAGSPDLATTRLGQVERRLTSGQTANSALAYFGLDLSRLVQLAPYPNALSQMLSQAASHPIPDRLPGPDSPAPGVPISEQGLIVALLGIDGEGQTQPLPPQLTAVLYGLLAQLGGSSFQGHAYDRAGRLGVAVKLGPATMIFDPSTYQLLESRFFDPAGPWYSITLAAGVVASPKSAR